MLENLLERTIMSGSNISIIWSYPGKISCSTLYAHKSYKEYDSKDLIKSEITRTQNQSKHCQK